MTVFVKCPILDIVKTAQVLFMLALLAIPATARAADDNIAVNIWNYPNRSINEITSWFFPKKEEKSQVLGTQDLTGATIIEDQNSVPDLTSKLDSTQSSIDKMYLDYQQMAGEAVLMGLKWDNLTVSDVLQSLDRLNAIIGENNKLSGLIQSWGWPELDTIMAGENAIKTNLTTIRSVVSTAGMQTAAYDQLRDAVADMEQIALLIGEKTDAAQQTSLYGRYKKAQESAAKWDDLVRQLQQIQVSGNYVNLGEVESPVLALNQLSNGDGVLSLEPKKRCLDLIALAQANKALLAQNHGTTITTTWIDEDPLRFKTLISNTSLLSRQQVTIKYYLPGELSEGDILKLDPGLAVKLDPDRQRLFVQGAITMAAGDTRIVSVETADHWRFDAASLAGIRAQTTELVNSLQNTSKFVEAVALKGDIETISQKISDLQSAGRTPEERIKAYREIVLQKAALDTKFSQVRELAAKMSHNNFGKIAANWPELAVASGGVGIVIGGAKLIHKRRQAAAQSDKTYFVWQHKKVARTPFNVFSSGIASSDL